MANRKREPYSLLAIRYSLFSTLRWLLLGNAVYPAAAFDDVEGVHLQREGRPLTVRARRGVLVAAGGFAHNLKMRETYQQAPVSDAWTSSNPGDTGEALQAMMRAGADTAVMDQAWWTSSWIREGEPVWQIIPELAKPHAILVDKAGRRLVNEANSYMEVGRAMYERHKTTPAIPAWVIMDAAHRRDRIVPVPRRAHTHQRSAHAVADVEAGHVLTTSR